MHLRRLGPCLLLAACGVIGLALTADAANWPRFRGPNGDGVAQDKDIPVTWTDRDVLWKAALPGAGNSSPIVWGDRLFLQSASTDGKERYLLCLSAGDGKEVWRRTLPGAAAHKHPKNTLASSTPATDGERVYAYFWDGQAVSLSAFDLKGGPLWTYDIGKFSSDHGAGVSPVVYDGKVYLLNDQGEGGSVIALDAKSGKKAWEAQRGHYQDRACHSTPFVLRRKGEAPELVVASSMGVTGYALDSGARDWQYDWSWAGRPLRTVASPVLADGGLIVANSGDGGGDRLTVAITPGSKNGTRPAVAWQSGKPKFMPYVPCFLSRGEYLYWVSDVGYAGCTAARTGATVWTEELVRRGAFTSSPVLIGDKVYAAEEGGDVFVFAAEPTYKLLARNRLGEGVKATPAVADGKLFVRGESHLYCIGKGK
jgi:outer membrane protein assembly factor BamB